MEGEILQNMQQMLREKNKTPKRSEVDEYYRLLSGRKLRVWDLHGGRLVVSGVGTSRNNVWIYDR